MNQDQIQPTPLNRNKLLFNLFTHAGIATPKANDWEIKALLQACRPAPLGWCDLHCAHVDAYEDHRIEQDYVF